jgi:SpoVK/Ycf46/Vps4 family AAA+-type ATPase
MLTDQTISMLPSHTQIHAPATAGNFGFKPFSEEEKYLIGKGNMLTSDLQQKVLAGLGLLKLEYETKRHSYIYSPPGAGKTFTVKTLAQHHGIKLNEIQGVASLSSITAQLAVAAYLAKGKPITVWIDDCDSLFTDADSLNVMKGALDSERNIWSYQKNLTNQITNYINSDNPNLQLIGSALQSYQQPGIVGVEIPTDNIRFIITSNMQLTPSSMLTKPEKPFWKPPAKQMHEAAIRSRVIYVPFVLSADESWGWLASVVMSNPILDMTEQQKHILLDWMHTNWKKLPDPSMRCVLELAAQMLNFPTTYIDLWNLTLN